MDVAFVDFYDVLGIPATSSNDEIKKAYRKMALRWHPEKNPANQIEAEKRFTEIAHAYETLTNAIRRESHDRERFYRQPGTASGFSDPRFTFCDPLSGARYRDQTRPVHGAADRISATSQASADHKSVSLSPPEKQQYRDAHEVFKEFFGGREPFVDSFFNDSDGESQPRTTSVPHRFDQSFSGFIVSPERKDLGAGDGDEGGNGTSCLDRLLLNRRANPLPYSGRTNGCGGVSSPTSGSIRHVTTSTRLHNGKRIVTKKVVENGIETVTVEEDGTVTLKTVNGQPVSITQTPTTPTLSAADVVAPNRRDSRDSVRREENLRPGLSSTTDREPSERGSMTSLRSSRGTEESVTEENCRVKASAINNCRVRETDETRQQNRTTNPGQHSATMDNGCRRATTTTTLEDLRTLDNRLTSLNIYDPLTPLAERDKPASLVIHDPLTPLAERNIPASLARCGPPPTSQFLNNIQDPLRSHTEVQDPLREFSKTSATEYPRIKADRRH